MKPKTDLQGEDPAFFVPNKKEKNKCRQFSRYCGRKYKKLPPIQAQKPINKRFRKCKGCPYPSHGFLCWGKDGGCLRNFLQASNSLKSK